MILTRVTGLTAIAAAAMLAALQGQEPSLATVMERTGGYAAAFQAQLSNIVAEERYVQDIARINLLPGRFAAVSHRELRSDLLLVRPPGADGYTAFRDVFEVDGAPVRDRQDRLATLFLDPAASAAAQIQRINRESARYNIGNIERTINTPTLPLLFLLPQNQARFRFTRSDKRVPGINRRAGAPGTNGVAGSAVAASAWVVEYEEVTRPTLIRTTQGLNLPARGRIWIDPETGRVLMSELLTEDAAVRAAIDVRYEADPLVGLTIPAEMHERYEGRRDGAVIEGDATYGHIRQFQVHADERIGSPSPGRVASRDATAQVSSGAPASTFANERPAPTEPSQTAPAEVASVVPSPVTADRGATAVPVEPIQPNAPRSIPLVLPPARDQPAPPTFMTGTELVRVDFVVTDGRDRPVKGLSVKDFIVKEDGRERPIVAFEAFGDDAAMPAAPDSPGRAAPPLSRAATVLLVDDGQLSLEQAARLRPALKGLLATIAERSGRLLLVAPGSNVSATAVLPGGTTEIAAAVDRIIGRRVEEHSELPVADAEALAIATGDLPALARVAGRFMTLNPQLTSDQANMLARERGIDVAHDARVRRETVYGAAFECLNWLASQPGRHSLIVLSGGFAHDPSDPRYYELVTRSLLTNAPVHFVDARGLQGFGRYQGVEYGTAMSRQVDEGPFGRSDAAAGATALADDTGGLALGNTNDMEKGLGRLLDSMTTYYVLAYQPAAREKPGFRRIRVEVRTRGLHVRARSGYFSGIPTAR